MITWPHSAEADSASGVRWRATSRWMQVATPTATGLRERGESNSERKLGTGFFASPRTVAHDHIEHIHATQDQR